MAPTVIPAKAGIQLFRSPDWMPASAGMTNWVAFVAANTVLMFTWLTFHRILLRLKHALSTVEGARDFNHLRKRHEFADHCASVRPPLPILRSAPGPMKLCKHSSSNSPRAGLPAL